MHHSVYFGVYIRVYTPSCIPQCITLYNVHKTVHTVEAMLARTSTTKIQKGQGARRTIYLKKELWDDSSFPLKVGEDLVIRIDGERLIIEKAKK